MCRRQASFFRDTACAKLTDMAAGETRGRKTRRALEPVEQSTTQFRGRPRREQRARALLSVGETSTDAFGENGKAENPKPEASVTPTRSQRDTESAITATGSSDQLSTAPSASPSGDFSANFSFHNRFSESSISARWGESAFGVTLAPEHSSEAAVPRLGSQAVLSNSEQRTESRMPDVFEQDEDGDTALHIAIAQTNQQFAVFLIQTMRSKTVDIYNHLRQTPLHVAVITHQSSIVRKLIEVGADVNLMDRNGQTPLHLACKETDIECARAICDSAVRHSRPQFSLRNFQGFTVLHSATFTGNRELIGLILDSGADINIKDSSSGRTALHHAVELGRNTVVEFLLSRGADVNASTYSRNTCLHTATGRDMDEMVKLLLKHGANVNLANLEGDTPKVVRSSVQAKRQLQAKSEKSKRKRKR